MLDVRQSKLLMLLLMIQAQHYPSNCFLIGATCEKSVDLLVNICAVRKNFVERRA